MINELAGVVVIFAVIILTGYILGKYIAKVYAGEKSLLDFMSPLENVFYRLSGIDPIREMTLKQNLFALLSINLVWFLLGMLVLMTQAWLPLNPDGIPNMSPHLAFNTTISFIVNCNLQHYYGESGVSYFSQLFVLTFFQFVSAATGMAAFAILINGLRDRTTSDLGNFWNFFIKSITRILLPICVVLAIVFVINGMPATYEGKETIHTLEGATLPVYRGPVAAMLPIKHLGTNGGGYFGANSAHPLENPNYFTNSVELIAQMIIPVALVFALGFYLKRRKLSWMIFGVMTVGFLALAIPTMIAETQGNPAIAGMGIDQSHGNMEGKEVRFGPVISGFWSIATTVISTGSVNGMQDSLTPLSGLNALLAMMINAFYGGVGVGFENFFIYLIIAVFISGLMVGRTPEMLGKKIDAREVKIAMIVALLSPFLILVGTAMTAWFAANNAALVGYGGKESWLYNPGFHGFSDILYEFTSSNANNGSGFESLGDNTPWWNITTGFVLILGRYIPLIGPVVIGGLMARKKFIPESSGTLRIDTVTFGVMIMAVAVVITALSFFPALALGPLAEYFSM
ncbi:potassium-transporting ATPase subunit KdpA [Cytophagaceae bacterium YF14B1]|uniref:Potassium-transporting ATPase potassium-binding subunit n=1 Tax=Xanthocytophaga flava TaxID=3048013 RepID=A0AAE3QSI1_9BACT|nr:potassium-transporting ATPase subunit KdpA [Xanthocytophaga flavus]MDJ1482064.1 potassium-transporting ATPase subunit KdpA [Xanthocytophaga flavus]